MSIHRFALKNLHYEKHRQQYAKEMDARFPSSPLRYYNSMPARRLIVYEGPRLAQHRNIGKCVLRTNLENSGCLYSSLLNLGGNT